MTDQPLKLEFSNHAIEEKEISDKKPEEDENLVKFSKEWFKKKFEDVFKFEITPTPGGEPVAEKIIDFCLVMDLVSGRTQWLSEGILSKCMDLVQSIFDKSAGVR